MATREVKTDLAFSGGAKITGLTGGNASGEALTHDQIGSILQAYDADLAALAANATNGLWARTGAGTGEARTITGTANRVTVTNGDGVSGNPTLTLPQDIHTAATPQLGRLGIGVAAGSGASQLLTIGANPGSLTGANHVSITDSTSGGALLLVKDSSNYAIYRYLSASSSFDVTTIEAGTVYANSQVLKTGNLILGTTTVPSGASRNLVLGGATRTLGAATADIVSQSAPDNGAGNAEWQCQPESGGIIAYGADVLRRVPTANRSVDDRIKSVTTTDATVTTVDTIPITASSTYLIETRVIGRRTGGVSGTADDGCSYVRRATYTTKAGTVTLMGSVQTIGTDAEDQAGWDATMTISGTNVLVRVTGAASNNISWQAHTLVERIAS